jgi:NAD(P)-dependent dehydrogenase (short-subunit alcohol dehydrogenase family)
VLVTGATTGIGRETATLFARRGATVVITGRDPERGAQSVAAIEAEGGRAEFIGADLNDIASVRRLAERAGEVDVLVNNAAAHRYAPTLEQDVDSFDMTFDVTVRAPFFLTAVLLPKMIARGSGVIVNISGALASSGDVGGAVVSAAAKAALESFTRSWARGLRSPRDSCQHHRARIHPHRLGHRRTRRQVGAARLRDAVGPDR